MGETRGDEEQERGAHHDSAPVGPDMAIERAPEFRHECAVRAVEWGPGGGAGVACYTPGRATTPRSDGGAAPRRVGRD